MYLKVDDVAADRFMEFRGVVSIRVYLRLYRAADSLGVLARPRTAKIQGLA